MQGFVVWFYVDKAGKEVFYEKEGINAGVSASFRYYPEHDINVVLLSNMEDGVWKPNWKLHEMSSRGNLAHNTLSFRYERSESRDRCSAKPLAEHKRDSSLR